MSSRVEECRKENIKPVSSRKYRQIFNENFNLSFHKPKKDQCSTCTIYQMKKCEGKVGEIEEESQKQHLNRKERAREKKQKDKQAAQKDPSKHIVTVDLQTVCRLHVQMSASCTTNENCLCTISQSTPWQMAKAFATSGMRQRVKEVLVKLLLASSCTWSHCQT